MATRTEEKFQSSSIGVVEESVTNGETGNPIFVEGRKASLALHPLGTAKVQFSLSKPSAVRGGTGRWVDWSRGNVTSPAADIPDGPITAVRVVSVSGVAVLEVVS